MTIKKKRLTIEELQRMPKDRFPLTVKCDDGWFTGCFKEVTILSPIVAANRMVAVLDMDGLLFIMDDESLPHFPSFEPDEPEEIEWFQVAFAAKRGSARPELSRFLYRSKEDFLKANGYIESDYHMIDLIPVKKYPDYSKR